MGRASHRPPRAIAALVRRALAEDRVRSDRTTRAILPGPVAAEGRIVSQASGVVSGVAAAAFALRTLRP